MQLNHYLNFQGQAEQAFIFYQSVFGGEFSMISRYGDMPPLRESCFLKSIKV